MVVYRYLHNHWDIFSKNMGHNKAIFMTIKPVQANIKRHKLLTFDNLRLGNWDIRFRWHIAFGGFLIGFITKDDLIRSVLSSHDEFLKFKESIM